MGGIEVKRYKQKYDYFLVVDFEATCDSPNQVEPIEIIEFPVLLIDSQSFSVQKTFHRYVQPTVHPILTDFCIQLTGILQEMVDDAAPFKDVFEGFEDWMRSEAHLIDSNNESLEKFAFVTVGNWDFSVALWDECRRHGITLPQWMKRWINIKYAFNQVTGRWPRGMSDMLKEFDIEFKGHEHSGIDDSRNTVPLLKCLAQKGFCFENTNFMT